MNVTALPPRDHVFALAPEFANDEAVRRTHMGERCQRREQLASMKRAERVAEIDRLGVDVSIHAEKWVQVDAIEKCECRLERRKHAEEKEREVSQLVAKYRDGKSENDALVEMAAEIMRLRQQLAALSRAALEVRQPSADGRRRMVMVL